MSASSITLRRYKRARRALERIAKSPGCVCGGLYPGDWKYSLVAGKLSDATDRHSHVKDCPGVIAAKALRFMENKLKEHQDE